MVERDKARAGEEGKARSGELQEEGAVIQAGMEGERGITTGLY